jgi:hypothetical protein
MFEFPNRMIEPDEITGECDDIEVLYLDIIKNIEKSDDQWMQMTLKSHKEMVEDRTDWDKCQKNVRRKRIIAMWHNTKILKEKKS